MNKEKIQEAIKVMQAFHDGKAIEVRAHSRNKWVDVQYPAWNWGNCDYRVKPEPLVMYVLLKHDGTLWGSAFRKSDAEEWAKYCSGHDGIIRKFVEELDS